MLNYKGLRIGKFIITTKKLIEDSEIELDRDDLKRIMKLLKKELKKKK